MLRTLLSLLAALPVFLRAQATYPATDYAAPGDTFVYSVATVALNDYTVTDTAFAWNYATLTPEDQRIVDFTDPDGAGYQSSWITQCVGQGGNPFSCPGLWDNFTNLAQPSLAENANLFALLPIPVQDWTRHFNNRDNQLTEVMIGLSLGAGGFNLPILLEFDQPDTLLRFPLAYPQQDSAQSAWGLDLSNFGQDLAFYRTQQRYNEVQGWGSLVTPYDSFPEVLKVRTRVLRQDSVRLPGDSTVVLDQALITYQWFAPGLGQPVLRASGNVAFGQEVITTVEYLDTLRCLTPEASFFPVVSPATLNADGEATITFFNTSNAVDSTRWDFGDNTFSGVEAPQHTYTAAGTYQVQLIGCNTICQPAQCDTATLPVVVIDTTVANASFQAQADSLCVGDSLDFVNFSTFSNGFQWNFGDGNRSTERNPRHAYAAEGSFEVQLIAFNTGANDTAISTVVVQAAPDIALTPDTTLMRGDSLTLQADLGTAQATYQWTPDLGGALRPRISPDSSTTYVLTAQNDCGSDTAEVRVTVTRNTGLRLLPGELRVAPNPSAGRFTVSLPQAAPRSWQVFDAAGRRVQAGRSTHATFELDLSALPAGSYHLLINQAEGYHHHLLLRR